MAGCGRRPTTGARGIRSSMPNRHNRSAPLRWRPAIATSFMWLAAKVCAGLICRWAMGSIDRTTRERHGSDLDRKTGTRKTGAFATGSRFPRWPSIRAIRIACLRRCWGIPYGANEERGIYRSTDGGQTWKKVLSKDANTGGSDVAIDPAHPDVVYAALWESRLGPWEDGNQYDGTHGGLFKSTDGGETWKQLTKGLPENLVQIQVAIAPSDHESALCHALDYQRRRIRFGGRAGRFSLGRCRRELDEDYGGSAPGDEDRRRRSADSRRRLEEPRCRVQREHRDHAINGWRQDLERAARRAGRR